ncbi:MAG TPA: 3TM-type holin [Rhodocyclaceae bacterium]|nr:3TM-type holin [Rhodocyclaceae bacterium]
MIPLLGIGELVTGIAKVADDLFSSDEERLKIALQEKGIEAELVKSRMDIDKTEAQHPSVFVAGWRPFH